MTNADGPRLDATVVAMSAVVAAAVAVATMAVSIPVGIGYLNFGEIVIYTAAFLFGDLVGALGGGIGAAAADVILGYAMYAPITLVAKGTEGFVVGRLAGASTRSKVIAVAAGAPFMIVAYVLARAYFEGIPAAIFQELPIDILQAVVGLLIALPLSQALQSRLPELQ
ncbi:ECF-type riboflavin transporter [Halanaeroarchaeum sp. HSR-CO]|uniref:ECF transporter S component n=1 Tax=Halanaeroarchaeum sp. HSR-CO TaxID=2866382 RepID=UPI00217EFFEF|nr:ECF transporter S component [Halanaeroarchaeum sp. HSR-CO]UWG46819.1 ECF-type riboflavin transporter [Halanaeroarchaeum sp. HSR-CO]